MQKIYGINIAAFVGFALLFAGIIILANYTVQYNILDTALTYGALTYPLSFLLLDVLGERYTKTQVLKILYLGLVIAFVPSFLASEPRIAIASVCAFIISQNLLVHCFFLLKKRFPRLWWLRNNLSTMIAQFIDTAIFFHIAFLFVYPWEQVIAMLFADFSMKVFLALCDTPLFYVLAIRESKPKIYSKRR